MPHAGGEINCNSRAPVRVDGELPRFAPSHALGRRHPLLSLIFVEKSPAKMIAQATSNIRLRTSYWPSSSNDKPGLPKVLAVSS
jgi:hypothetical protein